MARQHILADIILQIPDVLRIVELEQLLTICLPCTIDVQLAVDVEGFYEGVRHGHALGLHGMVLVVVELADLLVVEICHIAPLHYYRLYSQQKDG